DGGGGWEGMPETWMFRLGADVRCADGHCGKVKSLVVNQADDAVTHLVVEPAHRRGLGKLVPLRLAKAPDGGGEGGRGGTMAEVGQLDPAEAAYFSPGGQHDVLSGGEPVVSWPYYAPPDALVLGAPGRPGDPGRVPHVETVDTVADQLPGEAEVSRGE